MALFFTGDTHFGDHRTINIHHRPFPGVPEMDELLIERWNQVIALDDEVWHLGDFARNLAHAERVLPGLNGRKHLVRGNNDPDPVTELPGWESVQDYAELEARGHRLVLCHYPFRSWKDQHRKAINLHGHSHGRLKPMLRQIDVGVDAWDFRPVSLDQVLDRAGRPRV